MIKRVIWIVLDSVGMGALPDAANFGDEGADTIGHIMEQFPNLNIPNLRKLGYGNIEGIHGVLPVETPIGAYGRSKELSNGKDTTIGHWEMIGIHTPTPFPTYPDGFPKEVIDEFIKQTGCKGVLGNCVASGTTIINELGEEQIQTGYPIVYTSADSVFQIAVNENVIPLETLYEYCRIARRILCGPHEVARVIARPFVKEGNEFVRTASRRDYSKLPDEKNLLAYLKEAGYDVVGIGKIEDIFAGVGITEAIHTKDNLDGMHQTMNYMNKIVSGLLFTNLVEFDSKWGHRRDIAGYAKGLEEFDEQLGILLEKMKDTDLLIINADHGCDPSYRGTDHTREYIPVLMYHKGMSEGRSLGTASTFACIGQTIAKVFGVKELEIGEAYKEVIAE